METMTLQEIASRDPKVDAAKVGKLLDELDKIPRREKRGYRIAPYGAFPMRFVDIRYGLCPRCYWGALRRRNGCSGHS